MAEDKIKSLLERNKYEPTISITWCVLLTVKSVASQKWHAMPTIEDMKSMVSRKATIIGMSRSLVYWFSVLSWLPSYMRRSKS